MKDVAGMLAEKYGATADEIVAAGAMKLYLQSMEPAEALRKVRAVYEPKVIMLDSGEGVPVQSNIDGAKYAAFIDESVVFAAQKMRGRGDALAEMVMEKLKDLETQKTEAENLEIVQMVRALRMTPTQLSAMLSGGTVPGSLADENNEQEENSYEE